MSDDRRKKLEKLLKKRWAAYTFALCAAVLFYLLLSHINFLFKGFDAALGYVAPVIYGIVFAYLLNPVANFFEIKVYAWVKKENRRHNAAVVTGLLVVFALIGILIGVLIPSLAQSIASVINTMDDYIDSVERFSEEYATVFAQFNIDLVKMTRSWEEMIGKLVLSVTENTETLLEASQTIGQSAANIVLGIILAIYFLLAKKNLLYGMNRLRKLILKDETFESHNIFFERCNKILGRYLGFDIIDGIIVGCINAVLMLIFRMPAVALISVVVGVTNLLPTFGPIVGGLIGAFILVLMNPFQAFIFIIFTAIIQTFDGYILKPKMFGDTLGVPAVWVLVSIIVGGKIFGMVGILLAIPFAAIFTIVYEEKVIPWLEKRKKERTE